MDESLQLVRRCGLLRHRADGICALLDEHCRKLLLDSAFPRWPRSLEHRSLRQNHLAFALYACCCRHQQVMTSLWCEVALRRNRASLLCGCALDPYRLRVPLQQRSRVSFVLYVTGCLLVVMSMEARATMLGVARLSAFQRSLCTCQQLWTRLACCQPSAHEFSRCSKYMCSAFPTKKVWSTHLAIAVMEAVWTRAFQLVRRCGLLRHRSDGICALLDEH